MDKKIILDGGTLEEINAEMREFLDLDNDELYGDVQIENNTKENVELVGKAREQRCMKMTKNEYDESSIYSRWEDDRIRFLTPEEVEQLKKIHEQERIERKKFIEEQSK